MAQLRAIWHCEIFDTTPGSTPFVLRTETNK